MKALIYNKKEIFSTKDWAGMGLNRGLFFGESPFTTLKLSDGTFLALEFHLRRLSRSIYFLWNEDFKKFENDVLLGLKELHEDDGEYYFRITFTKALNGEVDFFIYKLPFENNEGEISLEKSTSIIGKTNIPNFLKVGNYLEYSLELRERDCSELVYFNYEGYLLECGTSNIFIVKDNVVYTPALIPGILDGITRSLLLRFLQNSNIAVKESNLVSSDLENCDEIWLTNGLRGVRAARTYEKRFLSSKLLNLVKQDFETFVSDYDKA